MNAKRFTQAGVVTQFCTLIYGLSLPSDLQPPRPAVTLKEMARELGLSRGSVSKALRNDPEISEVTRKRVQAAAREMGYQRNPAGAGLAKFKRISNSAVTLKDIGRELGLSHGSVSKALKNDLEISEATRERVQAVAREMGYRPNRMGTGLAKIKRNLKAALV